MQADLSAVEAGTRVAFTALVLINIALGGLAWWLIPLFRRRAVRIAHVVLLVLFNAPALAMIALGHHLPAELPSWLVSVGFLPAFAWHLTHFFTLLLILAGTPIWAGWGAFRLVRWIRRRARRADANAVDPARRTFLRNATAAVPAAMFGGLMVAVFDAQSAPEIVPVDIPVANLPLDLDGLRVVQVSDLHVGSFIRLDDVEAIVRRVNTLSPDLFVFTGDLCDVDEVLAPAIRHLSAIDAPLGRFSAFGNHEYFFDTDEVRRRLRAAGVPALVDEHRRVAAGGAELIVAGTDFTWTRASFGLPLTPREAHTTAALEGIAPGGPPVIALAHDPRDFDGLRAGGADVVLAGHTHGGQVVLWENDGRAVSPVGLGFPRFNGLYREGDAHLYVTAGAGHWAPFRVNCPREIAVLTLRRA
jgi:predicted MPP superfamily phosphohydrolase